MQTSRARIARCSSLPERRAKIYLAAARLDRAQLPCRLRTFTPAPADIPERRAKIDFTPFSRRSFASLAAVCEKLIFRPPRKRSASPCAHFPRTRRRTRVCRPKTPAKNEKALENQGLLKW